MSITYPKEEFLQAYKPSERYSRTNIEQKSDALPFLKKPKASYILPSFKDTSPHPNSEHHTFSDMHLSSKHANYDSKPFPLNKETPLSRIKNQTPTEEFPSRKSALSPDKFDALPPHLQQRYDQIQKIYNPPTGNTNKLPPKPSKSNSGIPFSRKSSKKFPAPVNNLFPENSNSQLAQPFFSPDPKPKRSEYQHRSGSLSPLKIPKYERKSFIPDTPIQLEDQQRQEEYISSELVLEDLRDSNLLKKSATTKSPTNMKYSKSSSLRGKKTNNSPQPSILDDSDDEILLEEAKDGFIFAPRKLTNGDQMRVMKASTDTVSSKPVPFDDTESPRAFHLANLSELQQRARAISVPKPSSKLRIVKNLYINNNHEEQERQMERKGYGEYSTHSLRSSVQVGMPIIINPEPRHAETEVTDRSNKTNAFFNKRESLAPLRFTQLRDTSNHKKWAESVKAKAREAAYRYPHNSSVVVANEHEKSHNNSSLYRTPKEKTPKEKRLVGFHERADRTPEPPLKPLNIEKEGKAPAGNNNENSKRLRNKTGLKLQGEYMNSEKEPNHQYLRADTAKLKSIIPSSLTKEKPEQPKLTSDQRYEKLMSSNIKDKFNEVFRALRMKKKKRATVQKKVQFSEDI